MPTCSALDGDGHLLNDQADAAQLWGEAMADSAGQRTETAFLLLGCRRLYGVAAPLRGESGAFSKTLKGAFFCRHGSEFIRKMEYADLLPGWLFGLRRKKDGVERCLTRGATAEMTRQQAGTVVSLPPRSAAAGHRRRLHSPRAETKSDDALFRVTVISCVGDSATEYGDIDDDRRNRKRLRLAREQQKTTVTLAVQKLLREIDAMPPLGGFGGNPFFDIDDDLEEEDMETADEYLFRFLRTAPKTKA